MAHQFIVGFPSKSSQNKVFFISYIYLHDKLKRDVLCYSWSLQYVDACHIRKTNNDLFVHPSSSVGGGN